MNWHLEWRPDLLCVGLVRYQMLQWMDSHSTLDIDLSQSGPPQRKIIEVHWLLCLMSLVVHLEWTR